jgi:peptidoglycan/xylan/chitin deacetylase (PgdA/CDA1 family)
MTHRWLRARREHRVPAIVAVCLVVAASTSCLGKNEPGDDLASQLARFPDDGRRAVDPIVTPGILSLTFDDGPSPYTKDIVDVLSRHGIAATFFCLGRLIPGQRDVLDYARDHGQQIANHSYNHEPQPALSEEVFKFRALAVKASIGDRDHGRLYFRFPYGAADADTLRWLSELDVDGNHYRPVGWHTDSQDFDFDAQYPATEFSKAVGEEECNGQKNPFQRDLVGWAQFTARNTKGGIILFHDTKRITRDKIEEIVNGFESPERYWASLSPERQSEYGTYYACRQTDPQLHFEFKSLWSGAWPSLRD